MSQARFELDKYTVSVLDVVKGKFGLKNRNDALNRFFQEFGGKFVVRRVNEELLSELDTLSKSHYKKHGFRSKKLKDVDKLLGL